MKWPVFLLVISLVTVAFSSAVVSGDGSGRNGERAASRTEEVANPVGGSSRSIEEGRRSKGRILKKMALPFLLLLGLKAGISIPLIFGAVALVAFKGMWSGATALIVTAALALRGLIPPSKIIQLPPPVHAVPHHVHVADYVSRMDENSYNPYHVPEGHGTYLPPNY
ncbi:hypothetical protein GE061_014608 [Apolygus lucorum]|uniref:Uncharacterized protein n=1 Tax=Apolygus lucorum TaxID=248454 RepID=A0A6A4JL01_APOLU|nr:hypothetical protein GE061_014608 [Apolygus lucorum]